MKIIFLSETRRLTSESGIGLVPTVFIISVLSSLILILAQFNWVNSHRNALEANNEKAFYVAESGIEYAVKRSLKLKNWDWNQKNNYADGDVDVSVMSLGDDTVLIKSDGHVGITTKSNSLLLNVINFMDYSVYVSGSLTGILGYDSADRLRFNATRLPVMDLDSLKQVAQLQGRYYNKSLTIKNSSSDFGFWSNPANHDHDANVMFVEKNLVIEKTNATIGGIFVVLGQITLKNSATINGIIYMANSSTIKTLTCKAKKTYRILDGGIVGNAKIKASTDKLGPKLSVYYNTVFLQKFYTYALNAESIITDKISWISNY